MVPRNALWDKVELLGKSEKAFPEIARLDRGSGGEARPEIACLTPGHQAGCGLDTSEAKRAEQAPSDRWGPDYGLIGRCG